MQARRKSHSRQMRAGASAMEFTSNLSRKSKTTPSFQLQPHNTSLYLFAECCIHMIVKRMAKAVDAATAGAEEAVGNKSAGKTLATLAAIPAYLQRE